MKIKRQNSGQAIMELLVLMLLFAVVFLGILLVMGLSVANVEIFLSAKYDAEEDAQFADSGTEGREIYSWRYTYFDITKDRIPFLPKDEANVVQNNLDSFHREFNDSAKSNGGGEYVFNDFSVLGRLNGEENFGANTPSQSYLAANLVRGRENDYGENIATIKDTKKFNRQRTYAAFEKIIGVKLDDLDLENAESNQVFFPAMKVLEK